MRPARATGWSTRTMRRSVSRRFGRCSARLSRLATPGVTRQALSRRHAGAGSVAGRLGARAVALSLGGLGLAAFGRCLVTLGLGLLEAGAGVVGHVDHRLGDLEI